jgi:hypothetical protein
MPKGKPASKYYRFSEEENAVDYLEKAYHAIRTLQRDPHAWKWLVLSLHGALYTFAICVLQGTDWHQVTYKVKSGRSKLIGFDLAIKRCQSFEHVGFYTHSKALQLTAEQKDAIRFLKGVRDQIEHYVPKLWSVEQHGVVTAAIDVLDVIRQLALDSGNVRLDSARHNTVEVCIDKGKALLQQTQLYKDFLAARKRAASRKRRR